MLLRQRRILSLASHLGETNQGLSLRIAVNLAAKLPQMARLGFDCDPLTPGQSILPAPSFGPSCRFNAEGKYIPQRHLPKETVHRMQMWSHTEYRGRDQVEVESFVSIPYQRYARVHVAPPSLRLTVHSGHDGRMFAASGAFVRGRQDAELLAAINVFLELFEECEVQRDDGQLLNPPRVQALDWDVLPVGEYPWERIKQYVANSFRGTRPHTLAAIEWRMEKLYRFGPETVSVGRAGFGGYVIFCYPDRDLYVLECRRPDNATYVLGSDWATLSKLSKAEILNGNLHRARVIHSAQWEQNVLSLFRPPMARAA